MKNNFFPVKIKNITIVLLCLLLLFACATSETKTQEDNRTPEQLYAEATKLFNAKSYEEAAKLFSKIFYQFPYYKDASKAHLMEIQSYYKASDYDSTEMAADNFIKIYPASLDVPYVYYLKGMAYYEQIEKPERDQEVTIKAKKVFEDLCNKFPSSQYSKEAKTRLALVYDHLAAQEMYVGRFYLNQGRMLAAINRFKVVVEEYQTTPQIEEALFRLVETYSFLELKQEAKRYYDILQHNYPKSPWHAKAGALLGRRN